MGVESDRGVGVDRRFGLARPLSSVYVISSSSFDKSSMRTGRQQSAGEYSPLCGAGGDVVSGPSDVRWIAPTS
jgi:hypothetical protein